MAWPTGDLTGHRHARHRGSAMADHRAADEPGVVTKPSPFTVAVTTPRPTAHLAAKRVRLFTVIDQSAEARQVGLELRDTTLVIFGNPAAGTPVMAASPMAALDLPLKVLVWDDAGQAKVSYYAPAEIAARHGLGPDLETNRAAIAALPDPLVAPAWARRGSRIRLPPRRPPRRLSRSRC